MNSDFVEWKEQYVVGIDIIDKQHKTLLHIINKLFGACKAGKQEADKSFGSILKKAVEYVKTHFSTEENLMIEHKYPDLGAHKRLHQEFVRRILLSAGEFQKGKNFVPNNFVRFLKDWLLEHIAITDRKLGVFIKNKS